MRDIEACFKVRPRPSMTARKLWLIAGITLSSLPVALSQEFEVAVVRPHPSGAPCGESKPYPDGRMTLSCFTVYQILSTALDLQPGESSELTGGPDWARTEQWDVSAKAAGEPGELPPAAYRPMLLKLAEEQFHLKLTHRTHEVKGLTLGIDPKARPHPGLVRNSGAPYRFDLKPRLTLTVQRVSTKEFAAWLKMPFAVGQRVEDRTGLQGDYDFVLRWSPESLQPAAGATPNDAPTILTALKEQLGLSVRSGRVMAEVYTIEAIQRPQE